VCNNLEATRIGRWIRGAASPAVLSAWPLNLIVPVAYPIGR
jgi:hypothetical protein